MGGRTRTVWETNDNARVDVVHGQEGMELVWIRTKRRVNEAGQGRFVEEGRGRTISKGCPSSILPT